MKFFLIISVIFAAVANLCLTAAGGDRMFIMKTYVAKLSGAGRLSIDSNGVKVLKVPLMTFNNKINGKFTRIMPPRSKFQPVVKITEQADSHLIEISYSTPGLVKSLVKKIILRPDTISIRIEAVPFKKFYSCSATVALFPKVFDGAAYSATDKNRPVSGKLPTGIPTKAQFTFNNLANLSDIVFTHTKAGKVSFKFTDRSRWGFGDLRAANWKKVYDLHFFRINYPAGKLFKCGMDITVSSQQSSVAPKNSNADSVKKKSASATQQSANVLFDLNFDNGFTAKSAGNGQVQNRNTPQLVAGISGKAARMASGKVLTYLEAGNLNKACGTLAFWVQAEHIVDPYDEQYLDQTIFTESGRAKPGSNVFKLWKTTWGGLRFDLKDKNNSFWGTYDIYNWQENSWHYIAVTWNNRHGIAIYVDGRLVQTAEIHKQKRGLVPLEWQPVSAEKFFIGAKNGRGHANWHGIIDEVKILDRDLSAAQIQCEYERFAKQQLKVFTHNQYIFAGRKSSCKIFLANNSDKKIRVTPDVTVTDVDNNTVFHGKFRSQTISPQNKIAIVPTFTLPTVGDYKLKVTYGSNSQTLDLRALPQAENSKSGGKLQLELVKIIDAVNPSPNSFVAKGENRIVKSPIGSYRETGTKFNDRFALAFEVPKTNVPYLAVICWPDNMRRSMEILFHSERGKQSYQAASGIFTGDAFTPSGKMQEYRVIIWPKTKKSAFIFMCLENGYPAAVKTLKIYRIKSALPKLAVNSFAGSVSARHIGIFYEDPVIPMCFGAGSLFPGFQTSIDRLLDYMQWFGQDLFVYPIAWYHGPLYGSDVEPIVANRSTRMHPDNYPAYLLKRLTARGMKFIGIMNIDRLESLDNMAIIDENRVFKGEETIANMRYDNHLQLTTPWNCKETRYNNFDPRVQAAVKNILREIISRYGDSPAFAGIMLFAKNKSVFGLGTLKGGYNDINLTRFQRDMKIKIPVYDKKDIYRFAKSYKWLNEHPAAWRRWITWRCRMLHKFYKELANIVSAERKDLKLSIFLTVKPEKPAADYCNKGFSLNDELRERGIDLTLFRNDGNIEISNVSRICNLQHYRRQHGAIIGIESRRAFGLIPELAVPYNALPQISATLFDAYFEDPIGSSAPMKNLRKILPHTRETGWRCSAVNKKTFYSLENYVAVLNNFDAVAISKGGFAVGTLGIEDYIGNFARAYRTLPAVKFDNIKGLADPIRVRQQVVDGHSYFYILNRLPVEVKFTVKLSGDNTVKDLVSARSVKLNTIILAPYELRTFSALVAVKVTGGKTIVPEIFIAGLKKILSSAETSFAELKKNGVPLTGYQPFINAAQQLMKEQKYARLYILLYESWVNDMQRLLEDRNLQQFIKTDSNYIIKQNHRRYATVPATSPPPTIDGKLDEKVWRQAAVISDFADFIKFKGQLRAKSPDEKTIVRLLYDDKNLYLGITCEEPDTDNIIIKKGLKDGALWNRDTSVEFFLKGMSMKRGHFAQLLVNAGNSKTDIFGGGAGRGWNIDWQAKSRIIPGKGWVCEIAVPLDEIRKKQENKLLFNLSRHRGSKPVSVLTKTDNDRLFCEDIWVVLELKK